MWVLYNSPQRMNFKARLFVIAIALTLLLPRALGDSWEQPAATLARQIAALAGPGPAQLILTNRSTLNPNALPQIRQMLEQDLRSLGVLPGGSDSTTVIRVTLSQNLHGGLWIAEVQEGTETRVTMLPVKLDVSPAEPGGPTLTLERTTIITEPDPVLDAQMFSSAGEQRLVVLEPRNIVVYGRKPAVPAPAYPTTTTVPSSAWIREQALAIPYIANFPRDMRGRIVAAQGYLFQAYLPGVLCRGADNGSEITLICAGSDDPWPVTPTQNAFYDSARNYFMGVLTPGFGMQLPPFYQAAEISHGGSSATLLDNVDGSAVMVQNHVTVPINGTGDWGSDLTTIHSACGAGTQVLVSSSGAAAANDSLRAYQISGREAVPVSAPLQVSGEVTAIWPSNSGDNAVVVIHKPDSGEYEVWSVAASCN